MAVACAAADLLGRRALELDLVFLIEGEEEAGSGGFEGAVRKCKVRSTPRYVVQGTDGRVQDKIGPIDAILVRSVHSL